MADETNIQAEAAAEAPAKIAETVAETTKKVVAETAKVAKRERAKTARRVKRQAAAVNTAKAPKTNTRRAKAAGRKIRKAAVKPVAAAQERIETVTNNFFNGFEAVPAFAPFQNMFADAGDRSQELVKKTQKVTEELADLARANVEAIVEAGRVATEGARAIGQDVVASSRDGVEQAADAIRSLAEAKSPTEYLQLQSDFARASFDRAVAETSKLTESLVKLAGEAFQPISNRATANAERFNTFVA
ncbi:phasin family protein [Sphingomonas hankyongi]|uniref:Phasin family protein n=1 Tax=Sphingomonas hankyongi TaxID=2908209 RepID=A0ABT0S0D8_9SPHN|nr:phasin family protein [Sphingomonas hankyongi]MCL6729020.1 phasin family protein [Sphingomonas hankyongi]